MVVLTALAARRLDGEVWPAFRAAMADTLSRQSLPGGAVVLTSRLANPALPLVAVK